MEFMDNDDSLAELKTKAFSRERKKESQKKKRPGQKKLRAVRSEIVESRKKETLEEIRTELKKHFQKFTSLKGDEEEAALDTYKRWLARSFGQNFPHLAEEDLLEERARSSKGAGGQRRDKKETAVRLIHLPTKITSVNQDERSLESNRVNARNSMFEKLTSHFELWKDLAKLSPTLDVETEIDTLSE